MGNRLCERDFIPLKLPINIFGGFASLGLSLLQVNNAWVFKRGVSPSYKNLPPLLIKERGKQVEDSLRGEVTNNCIRVQSVLAVSSLAI